MAISDAPIQISKVLLTVNDLAKVGDYYEKIIGLHPLSGDGETRVLGIGAKPLLELRRDTAARARPNEAGLFHTAFLLPDRQALADWLHHIAVNRIALDGASDHLVSEAIYLRDPEGNGIEIYADRPRDQWTWIGDEVQMDTIRLDVQALLDQGRAWQAAPDGTVVGHVHLQVGDVGQAEGFMLNDLNMDRTSHRFGASFFSTGGYHHHLAGNIWNSRGARKRSANATGLAEVVLEADADALAKLKAHEFADPWGTQFRVVAK
ncbi:VOC family protein [Paracoccus shanxieyensis]|uniref:VOC family protein n=1 Tax=Paracoccus shanxieyensis TaxID=2675752 RepID=A0A6L6J222_9RHOB|nr:VOC family protein [Paracoccus shanxieyensis]MTH65878.1 VOC family protein [Paracoccus shanxieyensis]MTH89213.1 VOC family protein [Paracoccus shanxieyensis]